MPAGYLYVLNHPSDPNLYKIGQTTRHPNERLIEHNNRFEEHVGKIVKDTGRNWELKTFIAVPDVFWAEASFWGSTGLSDMPYRGGIEIAKLDWKSVQTGLLAAEKAGTRPPPGPIADHVYAYGSWMKKRLKGRGIVLLGHVRSKSSGKSDFRCDNGHEWRTTPSNVAEGAGCPECGTGERTSEQIRLSIHIGAIFLLTHPNKPGAIKLGITHKTYEPFTEENLWEEWQVHRYLNVEEPELADTLIWDILEFPQTSNRELEIDLQKAEDAFRQLHFRLVKEIALLEKAKETAQ